MIFYAKNLVPSLVVSVRANDKNRPEFQLNEYEYFGFGINYFIF
jgi:hypothetical protein